MLISYPLRATNWASGKRRPWIAEIRGRDEEYEFGRKFLRPLRDWSDAGKRAKGTVHLWYTLKDGRLYEVHRHLKGAKTERVFVAVRDGRPVEITKEELEREIDSRAELIRKPLGTDVYNAARQRIAWVFDNFPKVSVSFSGGKDSTVLLHLAAAEARRRNRKIGLLFIDWEAQFSLTIEHVTHCFDLYSDCTIPYWVALPLTTVNACSQIEPEWISWDPDKRDLWVRQPPERAITDAGQLPFYVPEMTFEEFAPAFGKWLAEGDSEGSGDSQGNPSGGLSCNLIGLRADESLNRLRSLLCRNKRTLLGKRWTTWLGGPAWNAYPIYDWKVADIWTYTAREQKPYNRIYDRMHQAGLTPAQMRVCEPYGDEQRRGLWLYHILEPDTWARVVRRVAGAGTGSLYCKERGSVLGNAQISKPEHLTWKEFANLLLDTMPPKHADHYRAKMAVWTEWWRNHLKAPYVGDILEDEIEGDMSGKDKPSWRRVCKVLLKNDYWCKGLGFSPTIAANHDRYQEQVRKKIQKWSSKNVEG